MNLTQEQKIFIKQSFSKMKSKEDFLALLNYSKSIIYGDKAFPFYLKQISYHAHQHLNIKRYTSFSVKKKSGAFRTISAPNNGLKEIQKCLNLIFHAIYDLHPAAKGFVPGKSIVDNAVVHAGNYYVYNIDLKDFFPSIDQARIWGRLKYPPFNLNEENDRLGLANIIASLCCHEMEVERLDTNNQWQKTLKNVLPQGAPTSPTLSNIICQQMDFYLTAVAKRFGLKYSRYADDITFSSLINVFQKDGEFLNELERIVKDQGFYINESKTRLQKQGHRQEVTGLLVNDKPNVQKRYIKQLRMWLYYWETYGYEKANSFFIQKYLAEKGHINTSKPLMENVISGKLDFLKMVKGPENKLYCNLKIRYDILTGVAVENLETKKIIKNFQFKKLALPVLVELSDEDLVYVIPDKTEDITRVPLKLKVESINKNTISIDQDQEHKFEESTVRDFATIVPEVMDEIQLPVIHRPQELVRILRKFSVNNSALKYSTHSWDAGIDDGMFGDFNDFTKQTRSEFNEISDPLFLLKKQLHAKIYSYLLYKDVKKSGWGTHRIKFGWSSPELLAEMKSGKIKKPEDFIIPHYAQYQLKTNQGYQTIQKFSQVIDIFKNEIEIRDENSALAEMIREFHIQYLNGFQIILFENLKNKNFYTDVDYLRKALLLVFQNIQKRPQHREVSYKLIDNMNSCTLEIIHHNSFPLERSKDDPKLNLKQGDFGTIKSLLENLCDWSIETEFKEGKYRINYLVSDPHLPNHQPIDQAEGFKHLFKFYK